MWWHKNKDKRNEPNEGGQTQCAPGGDLVEYLKTFQAQDRGEFDLEQLSPGDRLSVVTEHTTYDIDWLGDREGILDTHRPDRACGRIRLMGCAFGSSSTIKPDYLFCGGNLEFLHDEKFAMRCTTTSIQKIIWKRKTARSAD
jgi:hypothetical protein